MTSSLRPPDSSFHKSLTSHGQGATGTPPVELMFGRAPTALQGKGLKKEMQKASKCIGSNSERCIESRVLFSLRLRREVSLL